MWTTSPVSKWPVHFAQDPQRHSNGTTQPAEIAASRIVLPAGTSMVSTWPPSQIRRTVWEVDAMINCC